jgi:hypothetical protein
MKNRSIFSVIQTNWFTVLAGVFCLTLATGVSAEQNAKPCADDAAKLCKGVSQGGGKIAKCLKEHSNELSPACKENIEKAKKKMQDIKQVCNEDAKQLCKDTKPGGGKVMQCLKQHESELSASCKDALAQPTR